MQTITANLSAGERREFSLPGAMFFMLLETVGPVDVEIQAVSGQSSEKAEGVESGFREKAISSADRIGKVVFLSSTTQVIKFGYSVRDADNRKVTSTVAVTDGSIEIVKDGRAFSKYLNLAAVASKYAHFQLINPAGSGKRGIVTNIVCVDTTGDTGFTLAPYNTVLAGGPYQGVNKKFGSSNDADLEFYVEARSALATGSDVIVYERGAKDVNVKFSLNEPIILEPGNGLVVMAGATSHSIFSSMQYLVEDE